MDVAQKFSETDVANHLSFLDVPGFGFRTTNVTECSFISSYLSSNVMLTVLINAYTYEWRAGWL